MVEDVVDLPSKLERTVLADFDVLEKGEIVVEDARHSYGIARHVSDLSGCERLRET